MATAIVEERDTLPLDRHRRRRRLVSRLVSRRLLRFTQSRFSNPELRRVYFRSGLKKTGYRAHKFRATKESFSLVRGSGRLIRIQRQWSSAFNANVASVVLESVDHSSKTHVAFEKVAVSKSFSRYRPVGLSIVR